MPTQRRLLANLAVAALGAASAPAFALTYRGLQASGTDATSFTFNGYDVGTASSDRIVIVIVWTQAGSNIPVSVTINGNAATAIVSVGVADSRGLSAYFLNVPSGTTADVVISGDGATNFTRGAAGVYTITGTTQTTYEERSGANPNSQTAATSVTTTAVTAPTGGVAIAASWLGSATFATTWAQSSGSGTTDLTGQVLAETLSGSLYHTTDTASQAFTASGISAQWRALAFTWGP